MSPHKNPEQTDLPMDDDGRYVFASAKEAITQLYPDQPRTDGGPEEIIDRTQSAESDTEIQSGCWVISEIVHRALGSIHTHLT
jgi:hypothetical protein